MTACTSTKDSHWLKTTSMALAHRGQDVRIDPAFAHRHPVPRLIGSPCS